MPAPTDAMPVQIFIGEQDRHDGKPLHEAIVLAVREQGLAGATVLCGVLGYGHSKQLHTAKFLRLSGDPPMLVEIVDSTSTIRAFLPTLDTLMDSGGGLV